MQTRRSDNPVPQGHRAVVVDESSEWLEAMERTLGELGIEVVGSETSPEPALACIVRERPDLLVIHDREHGGAGYECLRLVRERPRDPQPKAIVFAESAEQRQIDAAFEAGAAAYIARTVKPEDIASAIRQTFSRSIHFGHPPE